MKYYIQTYGCQMNYSDSERITTVLQKMKYKLAHGFADADLIILNTCSVKQNAEERIYGLGEQFKKLKAEKPRLKIGLTGCVVRQTDIRNESRDAIFRRMKTLDFIFKIKDLALLPDILRKLGLQSCGARRKKAKSYFNIQPTVANRAQIFVPIMTGCNNFCSYCIVPYSRGREESRDMAEVLCEAERAAKQGALEVNLVGQNVNSYNPSDAASKSKETPFAQLLRKIDAVPGIERVRFYTVHPKDMGDDVIALYGELRTMVPHIHLPLQSGCDSVLKRMNRKYDTAKFRRLVKKLRTRLPGISITTDVIVGFCGETEKEFKETCKFVHELELDSAYISKYSERPGTLAARSLKDDVPLAVKRERERRLTEIFKQNSYEYNQRFLGKIVQVLVEKMEKARLHQPLLSASAGFGGQGWATGKIPEFKPCRFPSKNKRLIGKIVNVRVKKAMEWALEGESVF